MNVRTSFRSAILSTSCMLIFTAAASAETSQFSPGVKRLGIRSSFVPISEFEGRPHLAPNRDDGNRGLIRPGSFGERIRSVEYGSPAYRAGLEPGDIIIGYQERVRRIIRHRKIGSPSTLRHAIWSSGRYLHLKVRNVRNGQDVDVKIDFYGGHDSGGGRPHFGRDN